MPYAANMTLSPTQQRNAVSEGLALGLQALGVDSIEFDKVAVDMSVEGAWRSWSEAHRFSQVSTDLRNGLDGYIVLTRAGVRSKAYAFYWEDKGQTLEIVPRQHDWSADNPDDVEFALEVISGGVALSGWVELAQLFLKRYSNED